MEGLQVRNRYRAETIGVNFTKPSAEKQHSLDNVAHLQLYIHIHWCSFKPKWPNWTKPKPGWTLSAHDRARWVGFG